MLSLFTTSIELGLLYSFLALSVYLTYRVIDYPDLSVDMSSTTGAGTFVVLTLSGWNPFIAIICGCIVAGLAGFATGFLHKKLGINPILSGVLTLSIFYTINLRIMGRPNLSLLSHNNLIPFLGSLNAHLPKIIFLLIIVFGVKFLIDFFLKTELGLITQAVGKNESVVKSLGNNPKNIKILVLFLASFLFGIGAIFTAQYQGFVDINGGIGNIIVGIASLMLGEAIFKPQKISTYTLSAIIGSICYEFIINIVLRLGLSSSDIKLFTALIVIFAIISRKNIKQNE